MRGLSLLVVLWLLIGAFAAYQRNYFANDPVNCAQVGTVLVTIIAGPLNYFGRQPQARLRGAATVEVGGGSSGEGIVGREHAAPDDPAGLVRRSLPERRTRSAQVRPCAAR